MQTYLQSTTVRLEEWRIKRTDTEQWMHHRQLPPDLKQSVRKYDQYKWVATRGVDEEALLRGLPMDLRRDIKRHLCFDLVRRVSHRFSSLGCLDWIWLHLVFNPHSCMCLLTSGRVVEKAIHGFNKDLYAPRLNRL